MKSGFSLTVICVEICFPLSKVAVIVAVPALTPLT